MSERDLIERLRARRKCQRCDCLSCGREGMGELHDHVCTDGPDCIETREKLRAKNRNLRLLCGDAADALRDRDATIATLSEALAEAEKKGAEVERLAEFARGIIRDSAWQGCDLDGADVQERALKAGLLRREAFDPAVHEDVEGYAEPGMDWFVFSGPLAPPRDLSQGGQHG